jgi:hypothetical protein
VRPEVVGLHVARIAVNGIAADWGGGQAVRHRDVTWVAVAASGAVLTAPWSTRPPSPGLPVIAGVAVTAAGAPAVLGPCPMW